MRTSALVVFPTRTATATALTRRRGGNRRAAEELRRASAALREPPRLRVKSVDDAAVVQIMQRRAP
ncbi:MAG: hypothetical protein AVDCRST_MAG89-2079 [uncultured Gemmatimonadetes bacterium]|uniref:Uncharacterized protein n=1 Tax=uncultured Gemmatimonadota bacterium TaxID=203437 RepID=A0A6J4LEM5_9BACT|nr:MAG: hypothetical protein AVDCRST_MAG89-2079 [uncultured Gemmatimonadota bacterium]